MSRHLDTLERRHAPPIMPLIAWEDEQGRYIVNSAYYGLDTVMTDKELNEFLDGTDIKLIKITTTN